MQKFTKCIETRLIFTDVAPSLIFKESKIKETRTNILELCSKLTEMEI